VARRDRLVDLRSKGDGHTGDGSAWEAYNAVTQSLDHDVHLWRTRGEGGRVDAALHGALGTKKDLVLVGLLKGQAQEAEDEDELLFAH
jgi:hypothetical protein